MLTFFGTKHRYCDDLSRRDFLQVGALMGGLTLADLLPLRAQGGADSLAAPPHKAVIMIYLGGGPSHIDMYDLKPEAPAEIRGEFKPIQTNVPGMHICELMPLQAQIADKLAILRGVKMAANHGPGELMTGFRERGAPGVLRPAFGSVVSRIRPRSTPRLTAQTGNSPSWRTDCTPACRNTACS